jgi:hypothetical protein
MEVLGCWVDKPREKKGLYNAANIGICAFEFMLLLLSIFVLKNCDVTSITVSLEKKERDRKFCGLIRR